MKQEEILSRIKSEDQVIDIGAGDLSLAKLIAAKGAVVTAIDLNISPVNKVNGVRAISADIIELVSNGKGVFDKDSFDHVLLINIIQFLDKPFVLNKLFPWILQVTKKGGYIYVETFSRKPSPNFHKDVIKSLYSRVDVEKLGDFIYFKQGNEMTEDIDKIKRNFFYIDFIIQKPLTS